MVDSEVYHRSSRRAAVTICAPHARQRDDTNRIIMDELVYGLFKPEGIASFQRVIQRMKSDGCDAVVLACTEIPLIIDDANSPLPTLDSTRLLARAALRRAVEGTPAAA
ncbi:MAG: aspartate/glutamate racemase family protein [Dongiaceae bacterium]